MRIVYAVVLLAIFAVIGLFIYSNMGLPDVKLAFMGKEIEAPQAAVIGGVYLLGAITGAGLFTFIRRALHKITEEPQQVGPDGKPKDKKKK